ncbi:dienelactone hydrolase family protein [Novosphingobium sp. PS1R-30]|uniref:Dienelactone hydrolase family protein n=1 Tax=Novosphingobium anseongense TaxID=3133436 RepID=A0ABU8RUL2_9SPHN
MAEGADAAQWRYHDGSLELVGEIFEPRGEPNGQAVLVVHEADGIGGNVRRHARGLADLGYIAAAADMHGKGRPLTDAEIPAALAAFKNDADFFRRRVRSAYAALKDRYRLADCAIGAIGYCFGGTAVLELARDGVPLAGVASFHGLLTTAAPAMPGAVRARVLACTGWRDPLVPASDIDAFQQEMDSAGADWQLTIFGRAHHSFTNSAVDDLGDPRMAFDAGADAMSWTILLQFLSQSFAR